MKKKTVSALLALVLALGIALPGCKKSEKKSKKDKEETIEETSEDESDETKSTKTAAQWDGTLDFPQDKIVDAVVKNISNPINGGMMCLVLKDDGTFDLATQQQIYDDYTYYYLAFVSTEIFFNMYSADYPGYTQDTYDEYIKEMRKDIPEINDILDDQNQLINIPENRFYILISLSAEDTDFIQKPDQDFLKTCISTGLEELLTDETLVGLLEKELTENTVDYAAPFCASVQVIQNQGNSAYITASACSLDGRQSFHADSFYAPDGQGENNNSYGIQITNMDDIWYAGEIKVLPTQENIHDFGELGTMFEPYIVDSNFETGWYANDPWVADGGFPPSGIFYRNTFYEGTILSLYNESVKNELWLYMGDGKWFYEDNLGRKATYQVEESVNNAALDRAYTWLALGCYSDHELIPSPIFGQMTVDWNATYSETKLNPATAKNNVCFISRYLSRVSYRLIRSEVEKDGFYYCDCTTQATGMDSSGLPYTEDLEFYEFIFQGNKGYYRWDTIPAFYACSEDDFRGEYEPGTISSRLAAEFDFEVGYEVFVDSTFADASRYDELPVDAAGIEFYRSRVGNTTFAVIVDVNGNYIAGFEYDDTSSIIYMYIREFSTESQLSDLMKDAEEHDAGNGSGSGNGNGDPQSASEWRTKDLLEHGFFDLSGTLIIGNEIKESPVVQDYLDHLEALEDFTFHFWIFGDYLVKENMVTYSDGDFYEFKDVSSHDNSFDYDITRIKIGDTIYYGSSDEDWKSYDTDDLPETEVLYSLPGALNPKHDPVFVRAYDATLDGEEFIVEEWKYDGVTYTYFCKNGNIIALSYVEFGATLYCYFTYTSKDAEKSLLKKPV